MFEAYKIGITLTLVNHVSSGLMSLSRDFARTDTEAKKLEKRIQSIHGQLTRGALMTGAGMGIFGMFKRPLEEIKQFENETNRFKALGLGDAATQEAVKFAKGMDVMGQSATANMKLLREATTIMGSLGHAEEVAPFLAKMKFGIESVMGDGHGANFDSQLQAALKVPELRGALINKKTGEIDEPAFKKAVSMMTQAYVASGGLVKPSDYLAFMKTGGVAAKLASDEMAFFGMGHFIQETGGSRAGTGFMSAFQNLAMGRTPKHVKEYLAANGLIDAKNVSTTNPMGLVNADLFRTNPYEWTNSVAVKALQAHNKNLTGDALYMAIARMYGIRTASNQADQFVREKKAADLYIERAKKAADVDTLYEIGKGSLQGKEMQLQAKYVDLMRELGTTVLPIAINALERIIPLVRRLSEWLEKNPEGAELFVKSMIGLATVLVAGGIAANVAAIIRLVTLLGGGAVATGVGGAIAGFGAAALRGGAGAAAAGLTTFAGRGLLGGMGSMLLGGASGVAGVLLSPAVLGAAAIGGGLYYGYSKYQEYQTRKSLEALPISQKGSITVNTNLDGKQIASVVVDHMGREVSRADSGTSRPDYAQTMPRPAGGFGK